MVQTQGWQEGRRSGLHESLLPLARCATWTEFLSVSGPPPPLGQGPAQPLWDAARLHEAQRPDKGQPPAGADTALASGLPGCRRGRFPSRSLQTFRLVVRGREGELGLGGRPASSLSAGCRTLAP